MSKDTIRQITIVIATVITIVVNLFSSFITGKSVAAISDRFPVPVTPAGWAFSVWGIIYVGLIAYAIYQVLPAQRTNPRLRRIGYLYLLGCAANVAWLFLWVNELITLSLVAIVVLLLSLITLYLRADMNRTNIDRVERWCVNIPFGIYMGWITVATIVNVTVVLYHLGWNGLDISPEIWTAILLVVGTVIALAVGITRVDIAYMATVVWAYSAILVKNIPIPMIAITAAVMIGILLLAIILIAIRRKQLRAYTSPRSSIGLVK
ncbi:MAG TPA: tryptophan-rich sensory protein [Ktedonobacteraceae bacterium]|nr:tryptophan-rich sensory protein [Ktedonobacteraceae bacterium]